MEATNNNKFIKKIVNNKFFPVVIILLLLVGFYISIITSDYFYVHIGTYEEELAKYKKFLTYRIYEEVEEHYMSQDVEYVKFRNGRVVAFNAVDSWLELEQGDSLIKERNELSIKIKKKNGESYILKLESEL